MRWQDIEAHDARVRALREERWEAFCDALGVARDANASPLARAAAWRIVRDYARERNAALREEAQERALLAAE